MMMTSSLDDPHERYARAAARAGLTLHHLDPGDASLRAGLAEWERLARTFLGADELDAETRSRLEDDLRIVEELRRVLAGDEPGEGTARERELWVVRGAGRMQGVCSLFECPGGVFIELLATAPWNLVRGARGRDLRAVPGVGRALLAQVAELSELNGHGGRVALQAENPRCLELYRRLGFALMQPEDGPLALVPRGEHGWSASLLRVAAGKPGDEEARSPWLVLDQARAAEQARRVAA